MKIASAFRNFAARAKNYHSSTRCLRNPRHMSTDVTESKRQNDKKVLLEPADVDTIISKSKLAEVPEVASWMKTMLNYNAHGGKGLRTNMFMSSYEAFVKPEHITEQKQSQARSLAWCIEMMYITEFVWDDLMDGSSTRRGQPCWYRVPSVGYHAITDGALITFAVFEVLRMYLGNHPHYTNMMNLFIEIYTYSSMGQTLDYGTSHAAKRDYALYTPQRYETTAIYKTSFSTFKLPLCLALLLADVADKTVHQRTEDVTKSLTKLYQMQDDYLDCYGDESLSGKQGTDIREGVCTWLAVNALQRCSARQRALFEQYYGSEDPEHIQKVKDLYDELRLPELYHQEEEKMYRSITEMSKTLPSPLSSSLITDIANMIYKRNH